MKRSRQKSLVEEPKIEVVAARLMAVEQGSMKEGVVVSTTGEASPEKTVVPTREGW